MAESSFNFGLSQKKGITMHNLNDLWSYVGEARGSWKEKFRQNTERKQDNC